ncbi:unnamed protein product, partial [Choristocarpus tenellus]
GSQNVLLTARLEVDNIEGCTTSNLLNRGLEKQEEPAATIQSSRLLEIKPLPKSCWARNKKTSVHSEAVDLIASEENVSPRQIPHSLKSERRSPVDMEPILELAEDLSTTNLRCTRVVSLISKEMMKKIQRVPPPGETELEQVQGLENAIRAFPKSKLSVKSKSGLYAKLGREYGLLESDIDGLTATQAGLHVDGERERLALSRSMIKYDSALARQIGAKKERLSTVPAPIDKSELFRGDAMVQVRKITAARAIERTKEKEGPEMVLAVEQGQAMWGMRHYAALTGPAKTKLEVHGANEQVHKKNLLCT